jgi:hypothetical protein
MMLLFLIVLSASCRQKVEVAQPAVIVEKPAVAKVLPECTIRTPLKPGVPGSPGHHIESKINPNGDSELAHLMRTMLAELQSVRNDVMNEMAQSRIPAGHERMVCTWPTDDKTRSPLFGAMAGKYMGTVREFNRAKKADVKRFNAVVDSCVACHEQSCRGPLAVIEPLKL